MSEHTNSMLRIRAAQLHARLEEAATAHQKLTAENAKLREQLAATKRLLCNVMLAEDKDLYSRIADIHEWLTVHDDHTA